MVCQLLGVWPDSTVSDDVPLDAGESGDDFAESSCWYGDFEIMMFAGRRVGE
jgi:hypothetical protein